MEPEKVHEDPSSNLRRHQLLLVELLALLVKNEIAMASIATRAIFNKLFFMLFLCYMFTFILAARQKKLLKLP
jgi:hypothetical protein